MSDTPTHFAADLARLRSFLASNGSDDSPWILTHTMLFRTKGALTKTQTILEASGLFGATVDKTGGPLPWFLDLCENVAPDIDVITARVTAVVQALPSSSKDADYNGFSLIHLDAKRPEFRT